MEEFQIDCICNAFHGIENEENSAGNNVAIHSYDNGVSGSIHRIHLKGSYALLKFQEKVTYSNATSHLVALDILGRPS